MNMHYARKYWLCQPIEEVGLSAGQKHPPEWLFTYADAPWSIQLCLHDNRRPWVYFNRAYIAKKTNKQKTFFLIKKKKASPLLEVPSLKKKD